MNLKFFTKCFEIQEKINFVYKSTLQKVSIKTLNIKLVYPFNEMFMGEGPLHPQITLNTPIPLWACLDISVLKIFLVTIKTFLFHQKLNYFLDFGQSEFQIVISFLSVVMGSSSRLAHFDSRKQNVHSGKVYWKDKACEYLQFNILIYKTTKIFKSPNCTKNNISFA